jgi:hypothetical protein
MSQETYDFNSLLIADLSLFREAREVIAIFSIKEVKLMNFSEVVLRSRMIVRRIRDLNEHRVFSTLIVPSVADVVSTHVFNPTLHDLLSFNPVELLYHEFEKLYNQTAVVIS